MEVELYFLGGRYVSFLSARYAFGLYATRRGGCASLLIGK